MEAAAPVAPPPLGAGSRVGFHEVVVHREAGRDPLLGCPRVRRFVEVDETALAGLDALREAPSIAEAERLLQERTGEDVDLLAFVRTLAERGFVRSVDGVDLAPAGAAERRLFARVRPEHVRFVVSPVTGCVVVALVAAWLAAALADPRLVPGYADLFVSSSLALVLLAGFAGLLAAAYAHELAHFFAARAFGVDATIRVSHRFLLLVLETDVTNAWTLPRRRQLAVFVAGSALNLAVVAAAMLTVAAATGGILPIPPAGIGVLRFVGYLNLFPLFFQLLFFARTDLYYVLLVLLRERNLLGDARAYMAWRGRRLMRRLRRDPALACPSCGARAFDDDPWCVSCDAAFPVADPNRYPFERRSAARLAFFAAVLVAGQVFGYAMLATIGLRFQLTLFTTGAATLAEGVLVPDFPTILAGEWLLIVAIAQAAVLASFAFAGLGPLARRYGPRLGAPLVAGARGLGRLIL